MSVEWEDKLSAALGDYIFNHSLEDAEREFAAIENIFDLPEIVYQAAFAPDFSDEGGLEAARHMTLDQRISLSRRTAIIHL
jgi:hypothetical protein